jgi:hypothetical protein
MHTPGPWRRSNGWSPTFSVVDHENIYGPAPVGVVAKVVRASQDGVYSDEKEANARLIAAAPEMYELLTELADSTDDLMRRNLAADAVDLLAKLDGGN